MIFCLFIKLSKAFRVSLISSQMKKIGVKHQSILEILRMKKNSNLIGQEFFLP